MTAKASSSGSMSTPPPKKKRGFFSCRSKHALDSLPRNARGDNAAINRLQARDIFQREADDFFASPSTAFTPLTEEKGLLKLAEHNRTESTLPPPSPTVPIKPLFAQEVREGEEDIVGELELQYRQEEVNEKEEARDVLPDDVVSPTDAPGVGRSMSLSSKTGRIKRSLSLKRSASTASAKLIARAPPVSSVDFADLPVESGSSSEEDEENVGVGSMASIRKARGRHAVGHQPAVPDISEDDFLAFDNVPIPPKASPGKTEKPALAVSIPESDSMRAVAAVLETSSDSARFRTGPSVGTPRMESPSSSRIAHRAQIRSENDDEDTVPELRTPVRSGTTRGFWDTTLDRDESFSTSRGIPFQYVTNLSRPVSIASLRSLATPSTPPRTSSRPTSPNGTYHGLRSTKSFSTSPLKQATFNGFPRTFFPASTFNATPRRANAAEEQDVERQLAGHAATPSHACSNCGVVEPRDFASFVGKGKASRHTSVKQQTLHKSTSTPQAAATGSLRKSKSAMLKSDGPGEGTLKRWGLAEAFKAGEGMGSIRTKKMVPGPGGGYITDTANMRWCSALDEIKKALKEDGDEQEEEEEEERVQKETQSVISERSERMARYGVAM
ncbi:hypothetical protein PSEUBRA_002810 [Kalmanozyma brasiliensis GHG001]|uniref:Uncharacterized protein n=1 Tax=Kalmanozyma brasiliensis (strain GHG001) TaxID=1365824 RepID=V5EBD8_KALBG|nr:uncharacterized protein PSEUBRA_002810 [Kalmanozyma brasiliensis GHG001]EST07711.1 hypothetical protein PSEUBRA_002810 [Kalmanozyma brasiliensis GHG001]